MAPGRVVVGRIVKLFGLRGEVLVAPTGDDPDRFAPGTIIYLGETGEESVKVKGRRAREDGWLVCFEGRPDRDAVEELARRVLYQDQETLPVLPDGVYYHFQLVGLRVTRADGSELGWLREVIPSPGSDLYEVIGSGREWLIPARREFVAWVDLASGEIRLTNRADLLDAQSSSGSPS